MEYRKEIDGLRALAVVPVILFHAGLESFSGGFVGVDVFFVISGYLITSIIVGQQSEGRFSLIQFYVRRAKRILPALFLVMACSLPPALLWMDSSQLKDFSQSLIAVSLFSSNVLFWIKSDYFAPDADEKPLVHTWSLAVEEQYYMLFPLLLIILWRLGPRRTAQSIAALAVISLALAEIGWRRDPSAAFYLSPTRVWELLAGALCALLMYKKQPSKHQLLAGGGLLLIVASIFAFDESTPFPSLYTLAPIFGTSLIVLYGRKGTLVASVLSVRPMVGIGLISYSAYLWHQPLFAFARIRSASSPTLSLTLSLGGASLCLAYLSWRFVEQPIRHNRRLGARSVFAYAALGSLFFLVLGVWGHRTEGFREYRFSEHQAQLLGTMEESSKRGACHTGGPDYLEPKDGCEYFGTQLRWAVFGDSHTVELALALANKAKESDLAIKHLSFSNCAPVTDWNTDSSPCALWTGEALAYLKQETRIDTVVVSYRIHAALFGDHDGIYPALPNEIDEPIRDKRWTALVSLLRQLQAAGKNVVFVLQAPELPDNVETIILRESEPKERLLGVSRSWWNARSAYVMARLAEVPEGVEVVDPTSIFCDDESCYAVFNDTAYYFDDDHVSVKGADLIVAEVLASIERMYNRENLQKGAAEER